MGHAARIYKGHELRAITTAPNSAATPDARTKKKRGAMFVCGDDPHVVAQGDVFLLRQQKIAPRPDRDESPGTGVRATGSAHAGGRLSFGRHSSIFILNFYKTFHARLSNKGNSCHAGNATLQGKKRGNIHIKSQESHGAVKGALAAEWGQFAAPLAPGRQSPVLVLL